MRAEDGFRRGKGKREWGGGGIIEKGGGFQLPKGGPKAKIDHDSGGERGDDNRGTHQG